MCNGKCNRISDVVYKCEEIRVSCFSKSSDVFDPIVLNGKQIEKILSWKVLGRSQMERKRESRLRKCYFALALEYPPAVGKHLVPSIHLALFYMFGLWIRLRSFSLIITAVIACVTEAFPLFRSLSNFLDELTRKHSLRNLPKCLSDSLLFLIDISYSQALFAANLPIGKISCLFDRRRSLTKKLLEKIINSNSYSAMNS